MATQSIRFYYNGIRLNGDKKLIRCWYSLDNNAEHEPEVSISCRDYSGSLPGDIFAVENETDLYTDYFDTDGTRLTPAHPLYPFARAAAIKAETRDEPAYIEKLEKDIATKKEIWPGQHKSWKEDLERRRARLSARLAELETLPKGNPTADDLAAVAAYYQAIAKARAEAEEAEKKARLEKVMRERVEGRVYIQQIASRYPIKEGRPVVTIEWSEHPAFYSFEDGELKLSIDAAEIILTHFDTPRQGYDKTKFSIECKDFTYTGRYDLGDGDGGLIAHIRACGNDDAAEYLESFICSTLKAGDKIKMLLSCDKSDTVFTVRKENGKLGIDWNTNHSPYICQGNTFCPFDTFAQSVIFENVLTGKKYHYSNINSCIEEAV